MAFHWLAAAYTFARQFGKSYRTLASPLSSTEIWISQEWIRMLFSLCYVPTEKMVEYCGIVVISRLENMTRIQTSTVADGVYEEESEDKPQPDKVEESEGWLDKIFSFMEYLDRTWIGRKILSTAVNKGQKFSRRNPLFPLELWNQVNTELSMDEG
jgi:hypothetical protein